MNNDTFLSFQKYILSRYISSKNTAKKFLISACAEGGGIQSTSLHIIYADSHEYAIRYGTLMSKFWNPPSSGWRRWYAVAVEK